MSFVQVHRPWFVDPVRDAGYLFPSAATDDGQLGGDAILRRFKKHSLDIGEGDEFGCHDVRRHVGSAMMRKNGDSRAVAAMLQQANIGSVDTYARLRNAAVASRRMRQVMSAMRGEVARTRRRPAKRGQLLR
jgi:site-specific recombinase XerD